MPKRNTNVSLFKRTSRGQALIEYVLIFTLVVVAFAIALAATGPTIGNVFSNTVYNLLGQTTTPRALGDAEDFWMTVTWVATQTPAEFPLPTKTLAPPKPTSTPGPSPTHTPITPTSTPVPTDTPGPTATPEDIFHSYPFEDTIDHPSWWRIDKSIFLGSEDWKGEYFANRALDGSPDYTIYNGDIDEDYKFKIDFNWGSYGPITDWNTDNFSIRWTRGIYIPVETTLRFDTISNNGLRIWLLAPGQTPAGCSATGVTSGGYGPSGGTAKLYGDPSTDCLLLDKWYHGTSDTLSVTRTIPVGLYTLQVDFYEETSTAQVKVDIKSTDAQANVDDRNISSGGVDCNWGLNSDYRDTNSVEFMWDEYAGGEFAKNMRCYLELRGAVNIPSDAVDPEFSWWDIWDFRNTSLKGWLELAVYDPMFANVSPVRTVDYGTWYKVNLHSGDTTNYNWSRQAVDLNSIFGDIRGKQLTWRFVMENGNNTSWRRWYIDDIHVKNRDYEDFRMGMLWDLDTPDQADDFITTGRWELTSKNKRGVNGMSWEDSPGGSYSPGNSNNERYERHWADSTDRNIRAHTVEFKGFIDVDDVTGATDLEGDEGRPILSFWHGYAIASKAWLEVQYTTDPYGVNANWQIVPSGDPGAPYGEILPYATTTRLQPDLFFVEVPLDQIPATRFRLRFALMVRYDASTHDGWWIDDIYLERTGYPKYTDYPFFDDAESGTDNWLMGGTWDRTTASGLYESEHSFTDSLAGTDYNHNSNSAMTLQYPFDLNVDSPSNPKSINCNPALVDACETPGTAASHPFMTFWHWRKIYYTDSLYVEWRRWSDTDEPANWHPLWAFTYRMNTLNSDNSSRMWAQVGWERVEIDLMPIVESFDSDASNLTDDDVVIRFRLYTDSGGSSDGVYLDDISIKDYTEKSHKLWSVTDDSAGYGYGNGATLTDDIDTPSDYWERWWNGGGWEVIDWEQHSGLKSWHDSVREDSNVQNDPVTTSRDSEVNQAYQTFSVLQMQKIIDLRGVDESDGPTLYFWSRFALHWSDKIMVQVSVEDKSDTSPCDKGGLDQCYEHVRGWSEWDTVGTISNFSNFTWTYNMIPLDEYAIDGIPGEDGKRIKIRFVTDSIDDTRSYDGWYIDDITIKYRMPPKLISLPFSDAARNLGNWIPEGDWGLSPEFHRGGGGGPASLGTYWNGYWWNTSWKSESGWNDFFNNTVPNNESPDGTEVVLDINHDPGYNSLFCYDAAPTNCPTDYVGGRWELQTGAVGTAFGPQPGEYTFITISDDGVRMRYDTVPSGIGVVPPSPKWNIINDFTFHGRAVDMGTATLSAPNVYKFTVEYFESSGKAVIVVSLGSNSFSFTDSPKQGAGPAFDDIPAVPYGNSSLLLKGLLDLDAGGTVVAPVMEYYTYYEMYSYGWVELSPDGGFCWGEECISSYVWKLGHDAFDDPRYEGIWMPDDGDWKRLQHDLSAFAGEQVGLRFRLANNRDNIDRDTGNAWYISWWFVDLRILDP